MVSKGTAVACFAALSGVSLAGARGAWAQPAGFEIPTECGSEAAFLGELDRLAGAGAERARPSALVIARESPGYRLTLEVRGERRELTHADCRVLFRSALVIAAASVRSPSPSAAAASPEAAPVPLAQPEVQRGPPRANEAEREDEREEPSSRPEPPSDPWEVRGALAAGAGVAAGIVPGPTAAVEVRASVLVERFGLSLSGKYLAPRAVASEGRGADIHAFGVRGALGYRPHGRFAVSAGFDADLLVGEGTSGIATPDTDSAWTLAPSLELGVIPVNTSYLALEIALQGRFAVQRPVFEVTGFKDLYQVPPWGVLSVARGVWLFP